MKKLPFLALVASLLVAGVAQADDRTVVKIPQDIKSLFLEEMRTHLDNLNEITIAISAGDFKGAAYVAESKMGFGHSVREVMMEQGKTEEEIAEKMEQMRQKHGQGMGQGQGQGAGMGRGMGRFMPDEVRMMGREFHGAAENFAKVARSLSDAPTKEDYEKVFTALSEIIDVCSACHSSYRVE